MKRTVLWSCLSLLGMIMMIGCTADQRDDSLSQNLPSTRSANPTAGADQDDPIIVGIYTDTFYYCSEVNTLEHPFYQRDHTWPTPIYYRLDLERSMEVVMHTYGSWVSCTRIYYGRLLSDDPFDVEWIADYAPLDPNQVCGDGYDDLNNYGYKSGIHAIMEPGKYVIVVEGRKMSNGGTSNGVFINTIMGRPVPGIPATCITPGLDPNAALNLFRIDKWSPSATATVNSRNLWNIFPEQPEYDAHFRFTAEMGNEYDYKISARTPDYSKVTMSLFRGLSYDDRIAWEKVEHVDPSQHNAVVTIEANLPMGEYMVVVESGSEAYTTDIIIEVEAVIPPVRDGTTRETPLWVGDFSDKFNVRVEADNSWAPFVLPPGQQSVPVYSGFTIDREMEILVHTLGSGVYATTVALYRVNTVGGNRTYSLVQRSSEGYLRCTENTNTVLQKAWLTNRSLPAGEYVIETTVRIVASAYPGYRGIIANTVTGRIPTGAPMLRCMPWGFQPGAPLFSGTYEQPLSSNGFWDIWGGPGNDLHFEEYINTAGRYKITADVAGYPEVGIYIFDSSYSYDNLLGYSITEGDYDRTTGTLTLQLTAGNYVIVVEAGTDDEPAEITYSIERVY